jgi:predicted 3-demethylubiquinone-9 3-methyltransferase (glyoxalase superfamily)
MQKILTNLWFDKNAEQAVNLYTSVFKDSRIGKISRYGKTGFEIHGMPEGTVLTIEFDIEGQKFLALNGGPHFKFNPSISFFVFCTSINETNELWDKLIVDGKALMTIDKYPWSERYGWLQDRYGLTWQISSAGTEEIKSKVNPSLLFTANRFGKAEEAIKFYTSIFKDSDIVTLIHYPDEDKNAGKVMYSEISLNKFQIIAMDGPGVHDFTFNEAVSFIVNCETQDEVDYYWKKLSAVPQAEMCGWLKDKYGVSWQIVPTILNKFLSDKDAKKSQNVMKALLQMKKINVTELEQAYKG